MAETTLVFDGHNDCLLRVPAENPAEAFLDGREGGHLDYPRARTGGFGGGLFALFVSPSPETPSREQRLTETDDGFRLTPPPQLRPSYAQQITEVLLEQFEAILDAGGGRLQQVESVAEIRRCFENDSLACVLHFEGAEAIEPDLSNLESYYERGLRSLGLVWSRPNQFGYGVPFEFPGSPDTGPGLTEEGKQLVRRCNELGIVVDLSHLNERGFWNVADISTEPLVVSHAGVHERCPSTRNLTDDQLGAVADSGGIVGITFAVNAIRPDGTQETETPIETLVDHFEYVVDRVGIDHVGFGSDFDGAQIPDAVGDASGLPAVLDELETRGFDAADQRKIARENWLRVLETTWQN